MLGQMMDTPLTITSMMQHAQRMYPATEIVSVTHDHVRHRYTFGDAFGRIRQLANALKGLGLQSGEVVGTLAWNDFRHFELYYAVSCSGMVCHTINPRLFPQQIEYIINHAEDKWLFVDLLLLGLIQPLAHKLSGVKGVVVLSDAAHMPAGLPANWHCYESLLASQSDRFEWPQLDENTASSLCYTSGTTGNPKGVLYSHRSTVLHSMVQVSPDAMCLSRKDVVLPIVPMFHANAWGLPYAAVMVGAKMVFPGPKLGCGETLTDLINDERINYAAAVPTIWQLLAQYLQQSGRRIDPLKYVLVGGAACPLALMEVFESAWGVDVMTGWGMTEMSPVGTVNLTAKYKQEMSREQYTKLRVRAGSPLYCVEMKIVDDADRELPWNGEAFGALKVRGPWIAKAYFKGEGASAFDSDGWFDTGDVATITAEGVMQITDRSKDVIKSGGEWISSIDLENTACSHPAVAQAAVIGVPHPKWDERPLLIVVKKPGIEVTTQEILGFLDGKIAKWWLPDDCVFVDTLPMTATGKISKKDLRVQFANYKTGQ